MTTWSRARSVLVGVVAAAASVCAAAGTANAATIAPPTAGFSVMKPGGLDIKLNLNISTHPTTVDPAAVDATYTITWGDGTTTVLGSPRPQYVPHTFPVSGKYTVTEVVDDHLGDAPVSYSATASVSNKLQPVPSFGGDLGDGSNAYATAGTIDTATLTVAPHWTVDPASTAQNVSLDWGDGSPAIKVKSQGTPITHTYAKPGGYYLVLKVNDGLGLTSSIGSAYGEFTVDGVTPVAMPAVTANGLTASATAAVSALDGNATKVRYCYSFGDGVYEPCTTDPNTVVAHTYAQPGTYAVQLIVYEDYANNSIEQTNDYVHAVVTVTVS